MVVALAGCRGGEEPPVVDDRQARSEQLAQEMVIVDTHIDVPYRLMDEMEDISVRTEGGDFDYPRAVAGGLDAPFMSIYVWSQPSRRTGPTNSRRRSLQPRCATTRSGV
jgi:hypothetical protein